MFLRDKLCRKKIYTRFLLLSFCLSVLLSVVCSSSVSAASLNIGRFLVSYKTSSGGSYQWSNYMQYGEYLNSQAYWYAIDGYQWDSSAVTPTGNYADIHFESNLVLSEAQQQTWHSQFANRGFLRVSACSGESSGPLTIKSSSVSSHLTEWTGPAPTITYKNQTLTVYGDVTVAGLNSNSQRISCFVTASGYKLAETASNTSSSAFWIEQQPTTISFYTNSSDAQSQAQIQSINNVSNSINQSAEDEQQRWEIERQEQADKEDELEDQADDLSLSTPVTSNPFTSLFMNYNQGCQTFTRIPLLFNAGSQQICSPYPAVVRSAFTFITSALLAGFLIRLYYKHLKGGMNG